MSGPIIYRGGYKVHTIVHYTGHVSVNSRSHKNGWIEEECVTLNISHVLSNNRLYLRTAAQYVSLFLVLAVISDRFHIVICSYSSHLFLCALGQYYRAHNITVLAKMQAITIFVHQPFGVVVREREHRKGGRVGGEVVCKQYLTSKHSMFSPQHKTTTPPPPPPVTFDLS